MLKSGIDYHNPRTKVDAINWLVRFWPKSTLMKKKKNVIFAIYHRKMREVLMEGESEVWRKEHKTVNVS